MLLRIVLLFVVPNMPSLVGSGRASAPFSNPAVEIVLEMHVGMTRYRVAATLEKDGIINDRRQANVYWSIQSESK